CVVVVRASVSGRVGATGVVPAGAPSTEGSRKQPVCGGFQRFSRGPLSWLPACASTRRASWPDEYASWPGERASWPDEPDPEPQQLRRGRPPDQLILVLAGNQDNDVLRCQAEVPELVRVRRRDDRGAPGRPDARRGLADSGR